MARKQAGFFGLKNAKYAFPKADGSEWDAPVSMPFAKSLSLNAKINTATLYADDRLVVEIPSDKGYEGTFGMTTRNRDYEMALGYGILLPNGAYAQLDAVAFLKHCIYFETNVAFDDNNTQVLKAWILNVTTSKAGESYTTKGDNIDFGSHEMPVTIYGTPLLGANGEEYVDENGRTRVVTIVKSLPGDTGYATFGDAVPDLKVTAN